MSSAKKQKTTAPSPSLQVMCTDLLWKESINGGYADDLVAALQACPKGRAALRKIAPEPIDCIGINRCYESITEGFSVYLHRTEDTEILFGLLDHYGQGEGFTAPPHHTGGYDIAWDNRDQMADWCRSCVEEMELEYARAFFKGFCIPKEDKDGKPVTCAIEWLESDEGHAGWFEKIVDTVNNLLAETEKHCDPPWYNRPIIISPEEMRSYINAGIPIKPHAVFTMDTHWWGTA